MKFSASSCEIGAERPTRASRKRSSMPLRSSHPAPRRADQGAQRRIEWRPVPSLPHQGGDRRRAARGGHRIVSRGPLGAPGTPSAFGSRGGARHHLPPAPLDRAERRQGSVPLPARASGMELSRRTRTRRAQQHSCGRVSRLDGAAVESGQIRPMSMLILTAIVTGPVHAVARRWLAGQLNSPLHGYRDELADAAGAALTGTPARSSSAPPSLARRSRITLELVSDDNSVIADGEATAELLPRQ
jgi:hypothetical protein